VQDWRARERLGDVALDEPRLVGVRDQVRDPAIPREQLERERAQSREDLVLPGGIAGEERPE